MKFVPIPRSLFGRLLAALLMVIGAMLLVVTILIVRERHELALWSNGTVDTAHTIVASVREYERLDASARADFKANHVASLDTRRGFDTPPDVRPGDEPPGSNREPARTGDAFRGGFDGILRTKSRQDFRDDLQLERELVVAVRKQLGNAYRVSSSPPNHESDRVVWLATNHAAISPDRPQPADAIRGRPFDLTVQLPDDDALVFRTETPRPTPPLPIAIFVELGIVAVVLTIALYWMTRSITKPLSDLARSADAVGRGAQVAPLEERGADELRNATRAFNTMQERLRRYLDSRTQVLAAMSHDLRTPITRLKLRAESIDDESLRTRFVADLDEMTQMVQGALGLFRGLNDREAFETVDVNRLVSDMADGFRELHHDVVVEGTAGHNVSAKPQALKRCLANLVDNAVKYGTRTVIHIEDNNQQVVIRVRDNGPGIPPNQLEQVFEPFFRVESSRNRDTGGTGLGLSIARDIAQAHGGSLTLRNLSEGGLEATLTIPRSTA